MMFCKSESDPSLWVCSAEGCNKSLKKNPTGWTNLINHVNKDHSDAVALLSKTPILDQANLLRFFMPKKGKNIFGWMEIVILGLRPFSCVEDKILQRYSNLEPICIETLMKYVDKIVLQVEKKITDILPDRFALVFDGWSCSDTHYVALFATYPFDNVEGYESVLLAFSPMGDEKSLDAAEHYKFIKKTLELFKKSLDNVVAFIADNCSTNKSAARISVVPMIGCASHRFNLAVMDIVNQNKKEVEKVRSLMVILRQLIPAAALREETILKAILAFPTRWGSYHAMVKRYLEIREFLPSLDIPSVEDAIPSPSETRKLQEILQVFDDLQAVNLSLQKRDTTMAMVRCYFDTVVEDFPELDDRLAFDAEIVGSVDFETAIVLIQQEKANDLNAGQRAAVSSLKLEKTAESFAKGTTITKRLSILQRAQKKRKVTAGDSFKSYMDTRFILPTSNMVESFFSRAGYALSDHRRSLLPVNLESQMFLFTNSRFWGVGDVGRVV